MFKYFISFKCNAGDGNGVLDLTFRIKDNDSVRKVEDWIREEKKAGPVTINNFILLEEKA